MRCEGAENPPCKRCRHANIPCMFEKPIREQQGDVQSIECVLFCPSPFPMGTIAAADVGNSRIQKLEGQVGTIQSTLEELVTALKGANAIPGFVPAPPQPSPSPAPGSQSGHYSSVPPRMSSDGQAHPSSPGGQGDSVSGASQGSQGSHTSPVLYMSERELQAAQALAMGGQRAFAPSQAQQRSESVTSNRSNFPPQGDGQTSPTQRRMPYPNERNGSQASAQQGSTSFSLAPLSPISGQPKERLPPLNVHLETINHNGTNGTASQPASAAPRPMSEVTSPKRPRTQGPVNFSADIDSMGPPPYLNRPRSAHGQQYSNSIIPSSNVTSAYSSDDEGELPTSGLTAPLEVLRSLVEHQEEERERRKARAEAEGRSRATSSVSGEYMDTEGSTRPSKRRKIEKKQARPHAHPDVVTKGIITDEEARDFFRVFYEHCSKFLPVLEPERDTYDELHRRSPFSVDAICMIASGVRDGANGQSEITKRLVEEVKTISSNTLWLPVARREVVQATILVAGWSTNGWLLGGHAVRMALELGIHKAWPRLLKRLKSGKKLKDSIGSDEHDLIVCSRIWFTLFLFEHQMSFGTGRPFMIKTDDSVEDASAILQHPLSVADDMRLVSSVELMVIRERLHGRLGVEGPVTEKTRDIILDAERQFSDWFQRWDLQFAYKWPEKPFYRHSLLVQRFLSELFHNGVGLRGIKDEEDVEKLPADHWQRTLAIQTGKVAQSAVDICCRSIEYSDGLKFAPDYTHVTATFAAAFLIRLARLFPKEGDLSAILKDVSSLAETLGKCSATRYAHTLKKMIRIAQKRR
ncbi:hypothetical protein CALVIDRAFT_503961, partial [Calocera viscosa TUFC12733]